MKHRSMHRSSTLHDKGVSLLRLPIALDCTQSTIATYDELRRSDRPSPLPDWLLDEYAIAAIGPPTGIIAALRAEAV